MDTYMVAAREFESGFDVEVSDGDGLHRTTLGFASEAEANAWVASAERMARPWRSSSRFGKSRPI
jgi:hypothetical protein